MNRLTWLRNPDLLAVITRTYDRDGVQSAIHLWHNPALGRLDSADDAIVVARQRFMFNGIAPYGSGRALIRQLQGNAQDHLLWDMTTQQPIESLHRSQRPSERLIAHHSGYFLRWDMKAGGGFIFRSVGNPLRTSLQQVLCANWSLDASMIVSATTNGIDTMVDVFSGDSGERLAGFAIDASALDVALSANHEQLAIRFADHVAIFGADGRIINQIEGRAKAMLWHPHEPILLIANDALSVIEPTGQRDIAIDGQIQELCFAPDGKLCACLVQITDHNETRQDHVQVLSF